MYVMYISVEEISSSNSKEEDVIVYAETLILTFKIVSQYQLCRNIVIQIITMYILPVQA